MSAKTKILLVHSGNESFVRLDFELLKQSYFVDDFYAQKKFPKEVKKMWVAIKETDVLFCWFASWNSLWAILLAKLLHKSSILVIGGYDLAKLPEANYGHQRGGLEKWISRWAMHSATLLFTNSYYSQKEAEQNAGISADVVQVIYHGIPDPFGYLPQKKERMVLTVGKVDFPNLKRKGLETFVEAAALLPDVQFVMVGAWADDAIDYLRKISSPNITFTGRITNDKLLKYYRKASVYVQASLHEGFGMSVAEAMLAGCIPVVTHVGSLPEVAGDCGIYCEINSPDDVAYSIKLALESSFEDRRRARERVLKEFPLRKRKDMLIQIIQECGVRLDG
jgi:glycosyltransferase involved in cell wall biosynthesis